MRWKRGTSNPDVIDDRGAGGGGAAGGGGLGGGGLGGGLPIPVGKAGLGGGGVVVLLVLFLLTRVLGGGGGGIGGIGNGVDGLPAAVGNGPAQPITGKDPQADQVAFIRFVLADIQDFWTDYFKQGGGQGQYERAKLVLFTEAINTGCGPASKEVGPFYCPADQRVYIDIGFMQELQDRFSAQGDFAEAYIIAHEVGHHVQNLLGIPQQVDKRLQSHPDERNELSVRQELQADCFAGVWARSAIDRGLTEPGDVEEALNAAAAVGDDRIQQQVQGRISPEKFTHGTAEQRARWLELGMDTGDASQCDTFSANPL